MIPLQKIDLGTDLNFSGYPIELFYSKQEDDYFIKCKEVYLKYKLYQKWKEDLRQDEIAFNKEGVPCKASVRNGLIKIGCLADTTSNFKKIEILISKLIKHEQISSKNK